MQTRLIIGAHVLLRGAGIFLGAFTLIGLIGEVRGRTTDVSLWFVDLHDVPTVVRLALLGAFSALLIGWGARSAPGIGWRRAVALVCLIFAVFAVRDVLTFVSAVDGSLVHPAIPVPLSAFVAAALVTLGVAALRLQPTAPARPRRTVLAVIGTATGWAVVFALAQMAFFGATDYRRPADAVVVFGARVYASGEPSPLLADRIRTGVELYRAGLAPILVMSGGDGADGFNEALVMRDQAIAAGVDPGAILVDRVGVSTEATVADTMAMLTGRARSQGASSLRLMAVSQAYHLPRVQLAFAAAGIDVLTVPTVDAQPIGEMPILIAREVPAFWAYYLRECLF
jgi:vancomycin permeability regulator SanA